MSSNLLPFRQKTSEKNICTSCINGPYEGEGVWSVLAHGPSHDKFEKFTSSIMFNAI